MLPVAAVLAGALFVTAVVDLATGTVPFINETLHIPELLSVLLVWLLAVPRRGDRYASTLPAAQACGPSTTASSAERCDAQRIRR